LPTARASTAPIPQAYHTPTSYVLDRSAKQIEASLHETLGETPATGGSSIASDSEILQRSDESERVSM
jgi:hypothetical protein